jgi:hypothetical protein
VKDEEKGHMGEMIRGCEEDKREVVFQGKIVRRNSKGLVRRN